MRYLISKLVEADNVEQAINKSKRAKIHNCCILPEVALKQEKVDGKDAIGFDGRLNDNDD